MEFDVKADFKAANRMLQGLRKKDVTAATNSAINKTIKSVQVKAVSVISKDMALSKKDTRRYIKLSRSRFRTLTASVKANGKRVPVHLLKARQTKKGVTYRGKGGKRKLLKGAFFLGNDKKRGAFMRGSKKRSDIVFLRTVSIPHVMVKLAVIKATKEVVLRQWGKNFKHEIDYRLKKYKYGKA